MKPVTTTGCFSKKILNFNEACAYLSCSKSYLYKLTHTRTIPHYKPNGKKLYFTKTDLENWILKRRIKSEEEILTDNNAI